MGDGGHNEMDSWVQLLIYSIVSLGFVTSLQSFYITGRPRKQFELPFQQRIESCLLKRSVKKYRMASSVIFIDSRYISLKGMICRIYLVKRRLDTHEMWKHFSNKTYVGNVMNSRNSVLTEMGQLERWLISKILFREVGFKGNNCVWNKSNISNICCSRTEVPRKGSMFSLVLREVERRRE